MEADNFIIQKYKELVNAHNLCILVYSRSQFSKDFARKIRPEFNKILIVYESKHCLRLLNRHSRDPNAVGSIDLMILDYDISSLKVLEHINKRSSLDEAKKHPLIPMVVILPEVVEHDCLESIAGAGGANAVIRLPAKTKDVFFQLLEILHRKRLVDGTFRDIKQNIQTVKYPFLPIFSHNKDDDLDEEGSNVQESIGMFSGSMDDKEVLLDDWTDCSSLMPKQLQQFRESERENRDIPSEFESKEDRLIFEMHERQAVDRQITKRLGGAKERSVLEADSSQVVAEDSQDGVKKDDSQRRDRPAGGLLPLKTPAAQDNCGSLLDPTRRPKWMTSASSSTRTHFPAKAALDLEIRPFIDKVLPDLAHERTVGGLDKRQAEQCWNVILGRQEKQQPIVKRGAEPTSSQPNPGTLEASPSLGSARRVTIGLIQEFPSSSETDPSGAVAISANGSKSAMKPSLKQSKAAFSLKINSLSEISETSPTSSPVPSHLGKSTKATSRKSVKAPASDSAMTSSRSPPAKPRIVIPHFKTVVKAERFIGKLTGELAHDVRVHNLIELNISQRKLNNGEKELLDEGLRHEAEGDFDSAISYYVRAGAHSFEPQISKIYLALASYRKGRFIQAIKHLTSAISSIEASSCTAHYILEDGFCAHYNRAIVRFRVGNDDEAVKDMEKAISLNPGHLQAKEVLALALRRLGKFSPAISLTIQNRNARVDMESVLSRHVPETVKSPTAKIQSPKLMPPLKPIDAPVGARESSVDEFPQKLPSLAVGLEHSVDEVVGIGEAAVSQMELQDREVAGTRSVLAGKANDTTSDAFFGHETTGPEIKSGPKSTVNIVEAQITTTKKGSRAATAALNTSTDHLNANSSLTTLVLPIREHENVGLKELTLRAHRAAFSKSNGETASRQSLAAFKQQNEYRSDLCEHIFLRPSSLQESLATPPQSRSPDQIQTIVSTLRLVPLLSSLSVGEIEDLADCIEYRPLTSKGQLFRQNSQAHAMCILLKGNVEVTMEGSTIATQKLCVGSIRPIEAFGYIDLMFRHDDPRLLKEIKQTMRIEEYAIITETKESPASPSHAEMGHENGDGELSAIQEEIDHGILSLGMSGEEEELRLRSKTPDDNPPPAKYVSTKTFNHRSLSSGMFASYTMTSLCELMLIDARDFDRLVYNAALREFGKRLETVARCGIFSGLEWQEQVRLARMSSAFQFNAGDVILKQGSVPEYLYLIMQGVCQVYAKANITEIVERKLQEAREAAERHDLKYTYHHMLRTNIRKKEIVNATWSEATVSRGEEDLVERDGIAELPWENNITESEIRRQELAVEITMLEAKLKRLQLIQQRNQSVDEEAASSLPVPKQPKQCPIKKLRWPMMFGEASILEPEAGTSRGTILAETTCEVFVVHKVQLQTFHVSDDLLSRVRLRAVQYPDDKDIEQTLATKKNWEAYRGRMIQGVKKTRWASSPEADKGSNK